MCFSASASFIASGVLATIGFASLLAIKDRRFYGFALVPLLFAIQQFSEGFVWLYGSSLAAMVFLFFAMVVWPTWIPLSLTLIENNHTAKSYLIGLTAGGALLSSYLLASICWYQPVFSAQGCHILYDVTLVVPALGLLAAAVYFVCTIAAFFVSTRPDMKTFGLLVGISALIAYLFFCLYFISVWCFFAALISSWVYFIVQKQA